MEGYCRICLALDNECTLYLVNSEVKEIIRKELEFEINPQDDYSKQICRRCKEKLKNWKHFKLEAINKQRLIKAVKAKQNEDNNNEEKPQKKDKNVSRSTSKRKQLDGTDQKKQSNIVVQVPDETSAKDISSRPERDTEISSHKSRSDSNTDTSAVQSAEVGTSIAIHSNPTIKTEIIAPNDEVVPLDDPVIAAINEEVITIIDDVDDPVTLENIKTEPCTANHPCPFCEKTFYFVESLNTHHRRHHSNISKCPKCPRWFKVRKTFCAHMRAHLGIKLPQMMCGSCFQVCDSRKELGQHRKSAHENVNLLCNLCDKKFSSSTELKRHKRSHRIQNKKDCTCKRCKKKFLTSFLEEKHQCTARKFVRPKTNLKTTANLKIHWPKCPKPSPPPATVLSSDANKVSVPGETNLSELDNRKKRSRNSAAECENSEEIRRYSSLPAKASSSKTEPRKQSLAEIDIFAKEKENISFEPASSSRSESRKRSYPTEKTNSGEFDELTAKSLSKNSSHRSPYTQSHDTIKIKSSFSLSRDQPSTEKSTVVSPTDSIATKKATTLKSKKHEKTARSDDHSVPKTTYHRPHDYEPQYTIEKVGNLSVTFSRIDSSATKEITSKSNKLGKNARFDEPSAPKINHHSQSHDHEPRNVDKPDIRRNFFEKNNLESRRSDIASPCISNYSYLLKDPQMKP